MEGINDKESDKFTIFYTSLRFWLHLYKKIIKKTIYKSLCISQFPREKGGVTFSKGKRIDILSLFL